MNNDLLELIGIIQGINSDGIINRLEIDELNDWLINNRNKSNNPFYLKIISNLDVILEDGIISDNERLMLIDFVDYFEMSKKDSNDSITMLNGIIEGIICDQEINDKEVYHLENWLLNNAYLRGTKLYDEIYEMILHILEDKIVTKDESDLLLNKLNALTENAKKDTKINFIKRKVRNHKNIGNDLINIINDKSIIQYIHDNAKRQIYLGLTSYTGYGYHDEEIIFISLTLIGLLSYNGNYYANVKKVYSELYNHFSHQKIESLIRNVISKYRVKQDKRIINYVLMNTLVPRIYLPHFFEFIFDIYKVNFDYVLNNDLYAEFQFIYDGLKEIMNEDSDDLDISVTRKTYKLIKSTKDLILTDKYNYDELIDLSISVIKLIDSYYWDLKSDDINNVYFNYGYTSWIKSLDAGEKTIKEQLSKNKKTSSRWELSFEINGTDIYLIPPVHKIRSDQSLDDISVEVYNGDQLICVDDNPVIFSVIGGYQVQADKIKLSNPLGRISYVLKEKETVLYNSKERLYRDIILFDAKGYEIKNNTTYNGMVVFCYNFDSKGKVSEYARFPNYNLGMAVVNEKTIINFDKLVVSFSSANESGIFGEIYKNTYLLSNNKKYKVYKKIQYLVFESLCLPHNLEIIINGNGKLLNEYVFDCTRRDVYNKYMVELPINEDGLYSISIVQEKNNIKKTLGIFYVAQDSKLSSIVNKIDNEKYLINVNSSFMNNEFQETLDISEYENFHIKFCGEGKKYEYLIPLNIKMVVIDGVKYKSFHQPLWIGDITKDSILQTIGIKCLKIRLVSSNGKELPALFPINNQKNSIFNIGELLRYKEKYPYIKLNYIFSDLSDTEGVCHNKNYVKRQKTTFEYNSIDKLLSVNISLLEQEDDLYLCIYNSDSSMVLKEKLLNKNNCMILRELPTFETCKVRVEDWKNKKEIKILYEKDINLFSFDGLEGHSYKIESIDYDDYRNNINSRNHSKLNNTYVRFMKQIDATHFKGVLFRIIQRKAIALRKINPVEIELLGNVMENIVEASITYEGDGLLYSKVKNEIIENLDDVNGLDIFSYNIKLKNNK